MDRLSRDQEDIAGMYKRLSFAGVRIVTIGEGDISEMHIGLKGTMNALFLKDLAIKTHRGLRGRVSAGKSGGGNSYGYEVVRAFGADGNPVAGDRQIKPAEADMVRRIFRDFVNGKSPRAIAQALNREKVTGPRGAAWGQSTINGNAERGTGILNNELYIGRLVWNRLRYLKDPQTGKRVSRPNPPEKLVTAEVPDLRIVSDELWLAVKDRQGRVRRKAGPTGTGDAANQPTARINGENKSKGGFWTHQRPRHLLTGLLRCGACGGGYTKYSATLFACAAVRNKGTCENRLTIRGDAVENIVFDGLKHRLMDPAIFKEFAASFIAERNTIAARQNAKFVEANSEISRIKSRLKVLVNAICDGVPARSIREEMLSLEAREDELNFLLTQQPKAEPFLHPNLAEVYRERVAALQGALSDPAAKDEAFNVIRSLIDEIRLIPENGQLRVEIRGALAGILSLAHGKQHHLRHADDGSVSVLAEQIKLVAGVGFEPTTFRL